MAPSCACFGGTNILHEGRHIVFLFLGVALQMITYPPPSFRGEDAALRRIEIRLRAKTSSGASRHLPRKAVQVRDYAAAKRIFSCNTALSKEGIQQGFPLSLSCLAQKSLALRCFAVLSQQFFVMTKHKVGVILTDYPNF